VLERGGKLKFTTFSIPGENTLSSALDIARAVTRRAERRSATLLKKKMLLNRNVLIYLNRLSDLLYLLARSHEKGKK
jgi:ATP:cob(I)alamin adenosyltransferase